MALNLGALFGPALGAVAGGLFGGQPQLPPELRRLYRFQFGIADQLRRFSQSVPLSDPGEQAALASQRGLLGAEQNQQRADLSSQFNFNTAGPGGANDFLQNLSNQQLGQRQQLDATHLLAALSSRRNALLQASDVAGRGTSAAQNYIQPPDLTRLFSGLGQALGYQRGQGQNSGGPVGVGDQGPVGSTNTNVYSGIYGPANQAYNAAYGLPPNS